LINGEFVVIFSFHKLNLTIGLTIFTARFLYGRKVIRYITSKR
jgi:hypothetical protein